MAAILDLQTLWMYGLCPGSLYCVYLGVTGRAKQIPKIILAWILGFCLLYGIRLWLESDMIHARMRANSLTR